jgi:hypothetical protein
MSFLTPLYLAALAAVSLPILLHLIRRAPRRRVEFSSLMFLAPSPPRLARRQRPEDWLLLLLRSLAIVALVLAFARPLWRQTDEAADGGAGRAIGVLVDTSASMRRDDLWQQAVQKLDELAAACGPYDRLAVWTFDRRVRPVVSFAEWSATSRAARQELLRRRMEGIGPTWQPAELGQALVLAAEQLQAEVLLESGSAAHRRQVVVVSDLARGSRLTTLESFDWPEGVQVDLCRVGTPRTTNAGLKLWLDRDATFGTQGNEKLAVRVVNSADAAKDRFTLHWADALGAATAEGTAAIQVPPGHSRVARVAPPPADMLAPQLVLTGDDHDFDNTLYLARPPRRHTNVVFLGRDAADDPQGLLYYLLRAFPPTAWRQVNVQPQAPDAPAEDWRAARPRLVVVSGELPADQLAALRDYLQAGGRGLWVVASAADAAGGLSELLGTPRLEAAPSAGDYALLRDFAREHAVFAPFAEPRFGDFTPVRFWTHWRLGIDESPQTRIVARFDDDAPALVERICGAGRLFVLTSSWRPADSQLARSSKFVPLLEGLLDDPAHGWNTPGEQEVGRPLTLPCEGRPILWTMPGKARATIATGHVPAELVPEPGLYTAELLASAETASPGVTAPHGSAGAAAPVSERTAAEPAAQGESNFTLAVNLAAAESDTAPLDAAELERLGVTLGRWTSGQQHQAHLRQLRREELERQQQLWRWLVTGALLVLVAETCVGYLKTARRDAPLLAAHEPSPGG